MRLLSRLDRGRPEQAPRRVAGFTLIETITVAVLMGTLVRVALPSLHNMSLSARAAEVVAELETVRLAVLDYRFEHHQWPEDAYVGQTPSGLAEFLPEDFKFGGAGYRLDWENWVLPSGLPEHPETDVLLGVSIVTEDAELAYAVVDFLGSSMAHYRLGTSYTFVFEAM